MTKDLLFGIASGFFFIFLIVIIITFGKPKPNSNPNPISLDSIIFIFLGLGFLGVILLALFGRRGGPEELQSLDQLYNESKKSSLDNSSIQKETEKDEKQDDI